MSEKEECKRDGATPQKNSGRGQHAKGDYRRGEWLIDVKEYPEGYTVSKRSWGKITMDAFRSGNLEPAIKIVLGTGRDKTRVFVISEERMHDYMERMERDA